MNQFKRLAVAFASAVAMVPAAFAGFNSNPADLPPELAELVAPGETIIAQNDTGMIETWGKNSIRITSKKLPSVNGTIGSVIAFKNATFCLLMNGSLYGPVLTAREAVECVDTFNSNLATAGYPQVKISLANEPLQAPGLTTPGTKRTAFNTAYSADGSTDFTASQNVHSLPAIVDDIAGATFPTSALGLPQNSTGSLLGLIFDNFPPSPQNFGVHIMPFFNSVTGVPGKYGEPDINAVWGYNSSSMLTSPSNPDQGKYVLVGIKGNVPAKYIDKAIDIMTPP